MSRRRFALRSTEIVDHVGDLVGHAERLGHRDGTGLVGELLDPVGEEARREHQLADQKHVEYINIYLAVAADDPEAISDSGFILEERIRSIGAKYHRISGRARLNTYVHTATTGIPLL